MIGTGWGIEAIWEYNGLVMNDKSIDDGHFITNINGFRGAANRDSREANTSKDGEQRVGLSQWDGKTITLTGETRARNFQALRNLQDQMWEAFMIKSEQPLKAYPAPTWPYLIIPVFIPCKLQGGPPDMDDSQQSMKLNRPFSIVLRASKPYIVGMAEKNVNGTVAPGQTQVTINANNNGKYEAEARVRVTGASNSPTVDAWPSADPSQMQSITFIGSQGAGDWIEADTGRRRITDDNGNRRPSRKAGTSDWITIKPGVNSIRLSAPAGAKVDVWWRDTWL